MAQNWFSGIDAPSLKISSNPIGQSSIWRILVNVRDTTKAIAKTS
jgi:hypothetical protein